MNGLVVKASIINKRGVFTVRKFEKGELVVPWHPRELTRAEFEALPDTEKVYVEFDGERILFLQEPERYVNHSCDPNTSVQNWSDTALRDIESGEEVTSDYTNTDTPAANFVCNCGSSKCRGRITPKS